MPTYLYICEINDQEFETTHSIKVEQEECLVCKEKNLPNHKPKQLIAGSTLGKVELSGHELTAKTKEDAAKFKREVYASERHYANVVGEKTYNDIQTRMDKRKR